MNIKTYSTENMQCPNCGNDLGDELQDLCFEPYNGTLETCSDCGAKLSLEMKVEVMVLNVPEEK